MARGRRRRCRRGTLSLREIVLSPSAPPAPPNASGLGVHQMDARGLGSHLGLALAPIDEHLQIVEAHLHIAVWGLHELLAVDSHVNFIQALFRHGDGITVAQNGIRPAVVLLLVGRGNIHKPQIVTNSTGDDHQVSKFHEISSCSVVGGVWPERLPVDRATSPCVALSYPRAEWKGFRRGNSQKQRIPPPCAVQDGGTVYSSFAFPNSGSPCSYNRQFTSWTLKCCSSPSRQIAH